MHAFTIPLEDVFARRAFSAGVKRRIQRLNPSRIAEGSRIRGVFFEPLSWRRAKTLLRRKALKWRAFRGPDGRVYNPMMMRIADVADARRIGLPL